MSLVVAHKEHSVALALNVSSFLVFFLLSLIRIAWPSFDGAAIQVLRADGLRFFTQSATLGALFDPVILIGLTFVGILVLLYLKKRIWALFFLLAMVGAVLSGLVLKELFEIARPSYWGPLELGWSFPSLHATAGTVFFLSLLYALEERVRVHALVVFWAVVTIASLAMVGVSRVYLGVHVFSDVLAGFALGVFWVTASILVVGRFRSASEKLPRERGPFL